MKKYYRKECYLDFLIKKEIILNKIIYVKNFCLKGIIMINYDGIYIEVNNDCNLNYIFCYNCSKNREYIDIQNIEKVIKWAKIENIKSIIISGGEPFLHPNFKDLLNIIKKNREITWHIVTNGTLLNDQLVEKIKKLDIIIHISVHSHNKNLDKKIRGVCLFENFLTFIKKLQGLQIKYYFKTVINKINYHYIEDIYRFAIKYGGIPTFTFVNNSGNAIYNRGLLELSNNEKLDIFKKLRMLDKEYNINESVSTCMNNCSLLDINQKIFLYINYKKEIYPCQLISDKKYMRGKFNNTDEINISDNIRKLIQLVKKRMQIDYGYQGCYLNKDCKRGCCTKALLENDDNLSNDHNCNVRRKQIFEMQVNKK